MVSYKLHPEDQQLMEDLESGKIQIPTKEEIQKLFDSKEIDHEEYLWQLYCYCNDLDAYYEYDRTYGYNSEIYEEELRQARLSS